MADKILDKNGLEYLWTKLKTYFSTATNLVNGSATGSLRSIYSTAEDNEYIMGTYAVALGNITKASGSSSHAEGHNSIASGNFAHAEGYDTVASDFYSHAEGYGTDAAGTAAHSEGSGTKANGEYSHAQNYGTIASSNYQTAIGTFNIEDANDTYAFIIGNGSVAYHTRSNALTVDWDGTTTIGASQDYRLVMGGANNYTWIDCRDSSDVLQNNLVLYANGITKVQNLNATGILHTPNPIRIEHDGVSKGDTPSSENWKAVQFLNDGATALSTAGHAQRTGTFLNTILTSGNIVTQMTAYKPEANSTDYAQISVWYPYSGSPYIQLGAETRVSGVIHVNTGKALAIHNTDVTKGGTAPSSTQYAQLHFMDKTANTTAETTNRLASVRQYMTTAGTNVLQMAAYKNDASVASSVSVGIYYPLTGTTYIQLGARTRVTNGIDVTSGKYINIHNSDLAKGSIPSDTQYAQLYFGDNEVTTNSDAHTLALLRSYVDTNGTSCCGIYALKNEENSTTSAYIRATYPLSGDPYIYANCLIRSAQEVGTGGKSAWNDTTNSGIWMTGASGQIHISSNTANSGGTISFHFNKSANATSSITEPASGTLRISGALRINGHSENIGYFKSDTKNDISLAAGGTGKTVTSLSLNIGKWVVIGKLTFPNASSATYIRGFIGTTNNSASADDERQSLNGYQTVMTISKVLDVTSDNTTYYLCASASVARTVSGTFQAIRIQ